MKVTRPGYYQTRDGRKARVTRVGPVIEHFPIRGHIDEDGKDHWMKYGEDQWMECGRWLPVCDSQYDLIRPWP